VKRQKQRGSNKRVAHTYIHTLNYYRLNMVLDLTDKFEGISLSEKKRGAKGSKPLQKRYKICRFKDY